MHVTALHPWTMPAKEAIALQRELASRVREHPPIDPAAIHLVAGVDVSCTKWSPLLTAGVVVWEVETGRVVDTSYAQQNASFPYVPGLLSFREIPAIMVALERLGTRPDVLMVDGQGRAHPRRLGIASHLGLLVDCPTIGVGKSRLCGEGRGPADTAGVQELLIDKGERIGTILRSKRGANPLYISVGNGMTQDSAMGIVMRCLRGYRLPEPTRLVHLHVNAHRTTGRGLPIGDAQPSLLTVVQS